MDTPKNVAGLVFFEITGIDVMEYHLLPDGRGKPTEVHLMITVKGSPAPLVMRFKSARGLDALIDALNTHRQNVFGTRWS